MCLTKTGATFKTKSSGKRIKVRMQNGAFEFDIWVPKAKEVEAPAKKSKGIPLKNRYAPMEVDNDDDGDEMISMVFVGQV